MLITGSTGVGKEVFAKAVHGLSDRSSKPLLSVNCGAIPETLLESELFGHEKGAFTGASGQRKGFFETADGGAIFLDEIGETTVGTQVKLLRVLESGEYSRLGSSTTHKVDVRVIAATNRRIEEEIENGNFRSDLYFRLKNVQIELPDLAERPEDIPPLANLFANIAAKKLGVRFEGFSFDALSIMESLPWHGNVRELKHLAETIVTLEKGARVTAETLRKYLPRSLPPYVEKEPLRETSLVTLEKAQDSNYFEFGVIFKTMLELTREVADLKRMVRTALESLETVKANTAQPSFSSYETIEENEVEPSDEDLNLAKIEKKTISAALQKYDGVRRLAAKALGVSERTLYRKISEYGLD